MEKLIMGIKDHRSINKALIRLNKINVVGGVNGSGKSTASRILYTFLKTYSSDRWEVAVSEIIDVLNGVREELIKMDIGNESSLPKELKYTDNYSDIINYANLHPYDTSKVINSIPLPITVDKDFNVLPCQNRKIIVFHGIIRPKKKGTSYIQAAMDKLQKEYPDKVECICKGGMPYDEYVKLFDRIDILVDQCNILEVGWGVNATIGAMKGKCVLVSCGDKNQEHMGIPEIPFVPIKTDSNQIYEVLKDLVTHPQKIDEIKVAGRKFTEKYCECSAVAKRYLESIGIQ